MSGFKLKRLGLVIDPKSGNPLEAEGVLNPAAIRGPDGQLYLFPRLIAQGNYSRIGIAQFDLVRPVTQRASSGSASHWSQKRITSDDRMAEAAVRIHASRLSSRFTST